MKNNNGEGEGEEAEKRGGLINFLSLKKRGEELLGGGGLKGQVYSSVHAD